MYPELRSTRGSCARRGERPGVRQPSVEGQCQGFQSLTTRERRMARSRVARGRSCVRAVATINRSAGSPWNPADSPSKANITSRSSGSTVRTLGSVARTSHWADGSGSSSRCLAFSSCASHRLTADRHTSPASAAASSASRSPRLRGEPGVSHQIQKCVSSNSLNGEPQGPPRERQTHAA